MLIIEIDDGKGHKIDKYIKVYKDKVKKTKLIKMKRKSNFFQKKSTTRRREIATAKRTQRYIENY